MEFKEVSVQITGLPIKKITHKREINVEYMFERSELIGFRKGAKRVHLYRIPLYFFFCMNN
jgi:hypothetical protein